MFYIYWFEKICEKEKDFIIICDGVGSVLKVNEMCEGLVK